MEFEYQKPPASRVSGERGVGDGQQRVELGPAKSPVEIERDKGRAKHIYWWTWGTTLLAFWVGIPVLGHMGGGHHHWNGGFGYLSVMLANGAATWACRRAGVSQEGTSTEAIHRDARAALVPFLSEAPAFALGKGMCQRSHVDREGIGTHKKKRLAWRDVETCDVTHKRNAVGTQTTTILINAHEKDKKKRLHITATEEDAKVLLPAIRFYLRGEGATGI